MNWVKEDNYLFPLSQFREQIVAWIEEHEGMHERNFGCWYDVADAVVPLSRKNQVLAWLKGDQPLQELSISRPRQRQTWGIPVPGDDTQTVYVWLDALTNYLTVTGFPGTWSFDSPPDMPLTYGFPPNVHIIGKDILK